MKNDRTEAQEREGMTEAWRVTTFPPSPPYVELSVVETDSGIRVGFQVQGTQFGETFPQGKSVAMRWAQQRIGELVGGFVTSCYKAG